MKEGKYAKALTKISGHSNFSYARYAEKFFYPNFLRLVWRRHAGAHLYGHQHSGRKPTETSVTEFYYKSVNLSLKEL